MNGLFEVARDLQGFCDAQGWRSCFIGGIAVLRWGEPSFRATQSYPLAGFAGRRRHRRFFSGAPVRGRTGLSSKRVCYRARPRPPHMLSGGLDCPQALAEVKVDPTILDTLNRMRESLL